jgi:hypothetical protein
MLDDVTINQIPFATSLALNNVAYLMLNRSRQQLKSVFDRPTPLIQGATRYKKSTKKDLEAVISIDPKREGVLKTHELGGGRGLQGLEVVMRHRGLLPSGYRVVPAKQLPLDAYGNPQAKFVKEAKEAIASGKWWRSPTRRLFVIPIGSSAHLSPGIYEEAKGSVGGSGYRRPGRNQRSHAYKLRLHTAWFMILREGRYKQILHWTKIMANEAETQLPEAMRQAIARALATAK